MNMPQMVGLAHDSIMAPTRAKTQLELFTTGRGLGCSCSVGAFGSPSVGKTMQLGRVLVLCCLCKLVMMLYKTSWENTARLEL